MAGGGANPAAASLFLIDVNAPDVSYDGRQIVFAGLPAGSHELGPNTNPSAWRLFVVGIDGRGLRPLTLSDEDELDLSQFGAAAGGLGAYDDSDLHRITAERNGADRPLVDPRTGKLVYARWWRNHWHLATIRPGGTGLALWAGHFRGESDNHAYGGGFTPSGELITNFFPMHNMTEAAGFGGLRRFTRGTARYQPLVGITAVGTNYVHPTPPVLADHHTSRPPRLPPPPAGPYDRDGVFTFDAWNVYANGPVDLEIVHAPAVGSAATIRFFLDHQRTSPGSFPNLDWPILLNEKPVSPAGAVIEMAPAHVPLFEHLRSAAGAVPLTFPSGAVASCVGRHAGHTLIPLPASRAEAAFTNLAPGAQVAVSSESLSLGQLGPTSGTFYGMQVTGLAEVEVIARGEQGPPEPNGQKTCGPQSEVVGAPTNDESGVDDSCLP